MLAFRMSISRRPPKRPSARPGSKTIPAKASAGKIPDAPAVPKVALGSIARPADRASAANPPEMAAATLARNVATLQERLAQRDAELVRERREREEDADTIAQMLVRIASLEKGMRETVGREEKQRALTAPPPARYDGSVEQLRTELASLSFDRDAADRQRDVARMQHRAAEAKLALVARQLEWAHYAAKAVESALPLTSAPMRASIATLLQRLEAARAAATSSEVDAAADSGKGEDQLPE